MSANIAYILLTLIITVAILLAGGEPDLIDALIYNLSDGMLRSD